MKKLFKTTLSLAIAVIMMSCGGDESSDFVGNWIPDLSSAKLEFSDIIPSQSTDDADQMLDEVKKEQEDFDEHVVLEFKADGTVTIGDLDESKDFEWKVDEGALHIIGEIEDATPDLNGEKFDFAFEILESSADNFTIKLTAQSIYDQLKSQFPDVVEDAEKQLGMFKMFLTEKVLSETWFSIGFKKKEEAHS